MTVAEGDACAAAAAQAGIASHGRWQKTLYALITYAILGHLIYGLLSPLVPAAPGSAGEHDLFSPMAALVGGYPLEEHFVTTADGYILRMFRIPHGPPAACTARGGAANASAAGGGGGEAGAQACGAAPAGAARPVAFMQHALLDSSAGWVLLGPGRALALQLVDAGFDVWLANSRGNRYSRNHTTLDPGGAAFWRFSWADMADHDVPAMVGHALAVTGQDQVVYFGYSQGSMIGLAALSSQPALAARVSLAVLMAPVAFTAHMASPPFVLTVRAGLDRRLEAAGWNEWGGHHPAGAAAMQAGCRWAPRACAFYLTAICGANPRGNLGPATLEALMGHLPVGTSVRNMALWSQAVRRGSATQLLRYDFGGDCAGGRPCNMRAYGQEQPPGFNLTQITTQIALYTGDRDTISPPADVALLRAALAPGVIAAHAAHPDYGHLDLLLGDNAPADVYPGVVSLARAAAAAATSDGSAAATVGAGAAAAA
ncbi:MAG: Alpha/Beta hydrolase protein [Monoraphidium minutum]|nr:MAG: Alpha/Beta hydrolase protein [Monoraphidium minutum]